MIEVKSQSKNVKNLTELCNPENFILAITACKAPVSLVWGPKFNGRDRDAEKKLKNFIKLIDSPLGYQHFESALNTLQQSKWNKGDTIPLTEDVVVLQKHLKSVEQVSKEKLKENVNGADWKILAETLLCQIILFNRRREGEASKLLLASYASRNVKPPNEDVVKSLTKLEQELCNELTRLEIRGKRGKKVPVLLTKDMVESMDMLNESRSKVGVSDANPYVFARVGALTHIRGSDCLRKFSKMCGAKDPRSLTSTKLRKQIATLSQIMNLKNIELDQLAKFLGHDIRVHREYYRLSENTIQLAKVSKLLLSLEKGSNCYKGKSLEEITSSAEDPSENEDEPLSSSVKTVKHKRHTAETYPSENEDEPLSSSVKTVKHKRHTAETYPSENEDEPLSSSVKTVKHKRHTAETYPSENEDEPLSSSVKTVKHKCHTAETYPSENEDEPLSSSVKTVKHKCHTAETYASENEDEQPSTSVKTVKRTPANSQHIIEMFSAPFRSQDRQHKVLGVKWALGRAWRYLLRQRERLTEAIAGGLEPFRQRDPSSWVPKRGSPFFVRAGILSRRAREERKQ
ncbi:hypothetical protein QQF64_002939 [Cirrhinus molitorella]|uniref:Uncharacterized protein n=1 Tax=Cirrhinus molitorella TaxID=172907 RepID=A0ABR3MRL4_9TELE